MRRPAWILAGAVVLSLLPLTVSGCGNTCGCAATPDPNWTPEPITAQEAAIFGAKAAGRGAVDDPSMTAVPVSGPTGRAFYRATAANTLAFVDAVSGIALEVVLEDRMPNDATVAASTADGRTAAEAFMQRAGMGTEGLSESAQLIRQAGVAAYDVEWKESGDSGVAKFDVWVNPSTGFVFAFVDLRMKLSVSAPIIGQLKATELAIAALGIPGETVTSAELAIDFATGSQASAWQIGLGGPTATQADVFEHGALVRVDAVTGETTIVKS
jgi:hypothetical protein